MKKRWNDYLWIASAAYLILGVFNVLFAWLGLICFITPLVIAAFGGNKSYCNSYCGRGQLFERLGNGLSLSRNQVPPKFMRSSWFRYGFLIFFLTMFLMMVYQTYQVFAGAPLRESITLLWRFRVPWRPVSAGAVPTWAAQFAYGFYSVMLTSTILGILTMILFRPRSWCVYCPMGTMTQGICKIKHRKECDDER